MIEIVQGEQVTAMEWATYQQIMRDRWIDGIKATKSTLVGTITTFIENTTDETLLPGLDAALQIVKGTKIDGTVTLVTGVE